MTETLEPDEVDELIASMASAPAVSPVTVTPEHVPIQTSLLVPTVLATEFPATREETDGKKPSTTSTSRDLPRLKSEKAISSTRILPPLTGNNDSPSTTVRVVPPSDVNVSTAIEIPCDLDALSEFLQAEAEASPQRDEDTEEHPDDRVSRVESIDRSFVLPPLLSSSHKSQSFAPHSPANKNAHRTAMLKQTSLSHLANALTHSSTSFDTMESLLDSPRIDRTLSPSRRRLTIGTHEISHHALERLGVNTDILKKEKGMKKLGISDVDIERFEEIRRHSGVPLSLHPVTKVEFMFGFTKEQLLRVKAINRLGTSEEEVQDEYSRQVSQLGIPIIQT